MGWHILVKVCYLLMTRLRVSPGRLARTTASPHHDVMRESHASCAPEFDLSVLLSDTELAFEALTTLTRHRNASTGRFTAATNDHLYQGVT